MGETCPLPAAAAERLFAAPRGEPEVEIAPGELRVILYLADSLITPVLRAALVNVLMD